MRSSVIQNNPDKKVLRFRRRKAMFLAPTKTHYVFVKRFRRIRACKRTLNGLRVIYSMSYATTSVGKTIE